jgi:hypothetical protein
LSLVLAGVMLAIAASCAGRLIAAVVWRRDSELDADGSHLMMGVAMAGMLAPPLSFLPARVWEVLFGLAAAWFAWQVIRLRRGSGAGHRCCPHPAPHVTESLAMVYMLAAVTMPGSGNAGADMAGMGGTPGMARFPAVAVGLALLMVGYAAWLGDRLVSLSRPAPAAARREGACEPAKTVAAAGPSGAVSTQVVAANSFGLTESERAALVGGPSPAPQTGQGRPVLAPRAAACYKIVMAVTMAYMLVMLV